MTNHLSRIHEKLAKLFSARSLGKRRIVAWIERCFLAHDEAEIIGLGQDLDMHEGAIRLQRDARENLAALKAKGASDIVIAHAEQHAHRKARQMTFPTQPARQSFGGLREQDATTDTPE